MKNTYDTEINAILNGASINSQAIAAGVNMNTLRRLLVAHPNYATAKAEGKLHQKGISPKLKEQAVNHPAVAEVVAGGTLVGVGEKYGIPFASLKIMVKHAHPELSLRHRDKTPEEVAELRLQQAQRALKRAQRLVDKVSGAGATA